MANLPQGWVECELGEVLYLQNGYAFNSKDYSSEGINIIRISDIQNDKVSIDNSVKYNKDNIADCFIVQNGDFLLAMSGATTGKTGVYEEKEISYLNQRVGNLKIYSTKALLPEYRNYFIMNKKREIEQKAYGGAQPNISKSMIESIILLLPPLNEQKRIVEKIEEEFEKIDLGIEKLKLIQEQIKQYKQSVLKSAFDGKLYKTTEWECKRLEEITIYIQRGKSPKYSKVQNNFYIINQKCIRWNILQCEFKKFVTPEFWNSLSQERFLKSGDILWNSTGTGTIGRAYLFRGNEIDSAIVDSHVTIVRTNNEMIISTFLFYYIMSPYVQYKIENMQNGSTNQVELGGTEIRNTTINLPTIEEQQKIVKEIEKRFEVADNIEKFVGESLEKSEQLKQSILKTAFEGRLVPQDPTDEHASVLLEKIKAERNS